MKKEINVESDGLPMLQLVLDTALDAAVLMDGEGLVRGWNDCAEATFGWSRDEIMGQPMAELIIPRHLRDAHEKGLANYLATGEGPVLGKRIEIIGLRRDGVEFPIELSIRPAAVGPRPLFIGFIRDISQRQRAEALRELMVNELNHRIRNLLSVVLGVAARTASGAASVSEFQARFTPRVQALGAAYGLLSERTWDKTAIGELIDRVVRPHVHEAGQLSAEGPRLMLSAHAALPVSMVLHELTTNAVKYGALSGEDGRVSLAWSWSGEGLERIVTLRWRETGVGPVNKPERQGFGGQLIYTSVRGELGGSIDVDWTNDGIAWEMSFNDAVE